MLSTGWGKYTLVVDIVLWILDETIPPSLGIYTERYCVPSNKRKNHEELWPTQEKKIKLYTYRTRKTKASKSLKPSFHDARTKKKQRDSGDICRYMSFCVMENVFVL